MKYSVLLALAASMVEAYDAFKYHKEFHNQAAALNFDESKKEPSLQDIWGQEWGFNGVQTFAHLPSSKCLLEPEAKFDVGIIGVPFDTATSYRPGARFGPAAIRAGSQRQNKMRGFNARAGINPFLTDFDILDCGDIPVTPMDNMLALKQMTYGFEQLYNNTSSANDGKPPVYIALGGDHSIVLPHLRAVSKAYGEKIAVIHFDAHLDTWAPTSYPNFWHSDQSEFTHGSMLWMAQEEGLITEDQNLHIGVRSKLGGVDFFDYDHDDVVGFKRLDADDVWLKGVDYVAQAALDRIGKDTPVFVTVDIDVLDPAAAPGTGTIEPGGLLPRELIFLLRKLESLNIVAADVVEVSPSYDFADVTATNAAQVVYEILTSVTKRFLGLTNVESDEADQKADDSTDAEQVLEETVQTLKEINQNVLDAAKNIINNY